MRLASALCVLAALATAACVPRELIFQFAGLPPPALRDFAADFTPPISNETGIPVSGFGGKDGGGVSHVPVIFVHGNTVGPDYWLPMRAAFKAAGYTDDELWAVGYGWESTRALDNATLSAVTLERFVAAVQDYLGKKSGHRVERFDVVSHSLGVTVAREWLRQANRTHSVRAFVGIAGANHGVWTSGPDTRGQNRVVSFELYPGSPWLAQLNAAGETPGPTHYFTLYDGGGWADVLFPKPTQDSSALAGATNLPINRERGSFYGHLQLGRSAEPIQQVLNWLKAEPLPKASSSPPEVLRAGAALTTSQPEAKLYCSSSAEEPRLQGLGEWRVVLAADAISSCFAYNVKTRLASPLGRYTTTAGTAAEASAAEPSFAAISISANPAPGPYANPVRVQLSASEPGATIVYSLTPGAVSSGSPRYAAPIYLPGPAQITAQALAADGRLSMPVRFDYDISIEKVDAQFAWDRQLNADADEHYAGKRHKGN